MGSRLDRTGGRRIIVRCFFRCLFPSCLRVVFWSGSCDILTEICAIWVPLGRLLATFLRFVGFCWMALSLERKPIFPGFGGPRSALLRPLFQVWIQGVCFNGFYLVFCDLGAPLGFLWGPFGHPFLGN